MAYRIDVVVYGLGKADYGELVVVFLQKFCKIRRGGVRVVSAYRMQNVNFILYELVGRDFLRVFAFFYKPALYAVLYVGQLHARVPYRGAAGSVQNVGLRSHLVVDFYALPEKQSLVSAEIAYYLY